VITKCYTLPDLNNRKLFFTVLEGRKTKIKALEDSISGGGLLSGCVLTWQKR
jgi:hypothetical protein